MSAESYTSGESLQEAAVPLENVNQTHVTVQERQVPLVALESERAKRQQLEEENRLMKEHFALMQAQTSPQAPVQKDELDLMDDSDVMTVGEFKKISSKMANQFQGTLDEIRMQQKHPDYQEVISKYLPEVLKNNPNLRASLQKSQDYELAYYLAKNSDSYKSTNQKFERNVEAERIIKNSGQAGTLSSLGSSTPVSQAKRYKDMSDSEFKNLMHKNLGY